MAIRKQKSLLISRKLAQIDLLNFESHNDLLILVSLLIDAGRGPQVTVENG